MTSPPVVTPWCDAKHYDHRRPDGTPYASSPYCTCSKTPGHEDDHKCWGCGRTWKNEIAPCAGGQLLDIGQAEAIARMHRPDSMDFR